MANSFVVEAYSPSKKPFEDDFIMFSEFSEQEGPKPLLTIPRDAGGTFDKNSFAVRIMAVDYQTGELGSFQETKDTQVVLSEGYDPATKVYAFVYHLTLHDIHARGYVRPFCMTYLTLDERKILVHFEELLHEFAKVSEVLKHGNYPVFYQELKQRLSDLNHTQDELVSAQSQLPEDTPSKKADNLAFQLEQCRDSLQEIQGVLSVVEVLVERGRKSELETQVSRFEELCETHRSTSEVNMFSGNSRSNDSESGDMVFVDRPPANTSPGSEPSEAAATSAPSTSTPSAATANIPGLNQPLTFDVLKSKRFDQKLRSLVGLCGVCSKLGLGHLRRILNHFGRDHEGVAVEGEEFQCLEPQSALLTVGRRIVLNFLNGIDGCCAQCEWPLGTGATAWRVPVFYRSQSALTVSSWGEMSFKSCAEELSGLEDAACTPPVFKEFFDAVDGSGVAVGSASEVRPMQPDSYDDMHSLPQSDQSTEGLPLSHPHLNHLPSPDKKGIVMGWLNASSDVHDDQQTLSQPLEALASRASPSSTHSSLTADPSAQANSTDASLIFDPVTVGRDSYPLSSSPISQQQAHAPAAQRTVSSPSSTATVKRTASFWDETDRLEPDSSHHPVGLVPRQEPSELDEEECSTPGVRSSSTTAHVEEVTRGQSRSSTVSRETLTLPLSSSPPSASRRAPPAIAQAVQPQPEDSVQPVRKTMPVAGVSAVAAPPAKSTGGGGIPAGNQVPLLQPLPNTLISSFSDDLCHSFEGRPGSGLLKFRDRYVFAVHLVYALLRGRPVVVLGKSESDVKAMVQTLSVFVPGHSSHHQIIDWHTKPMNISHLARVKLIGLQKSRMLMVPQSVKPYVSIFDYGVGTLTTPPYKGSYVSSIVHRQKKWMDDRSYLAHVHSVFLQMGTKAFLYFHNFCLNMPLTRDRTTKVPSAHAEPDRYAHSRASKNGFLTHLGVADCDRHIIEYFVEVVKMQQMAQYRHSNRMDGDDYPPVIRLDHSKCMVYKGRK